MRAYWALPSPCAPLHPAPSVEKLPCAAALHFSAHPRVMESELHLTPGSCHFFLIPFSRFTFAQIRGRCTVAPDWLLHEYPGGTFSPANSPVPPTVPRFGDHHHPSSSVHQNICKKPFLQLLKLPIVQNISPHTPAFVTVTGAPGGQIGGRVWTNLSLSSWFKLAQAPTSLCLHQLQSQQTVARPF